MPKITKTYVVKVEGSDRVMLRSLKSMLGRLSVLDYGGSAKVVKVTEIRKKQ